MRLENLRSLLPVRRPKRRPVKVSRNELRVGDYVESLPMVLGVNGYITAIHREYGRNGTEWIYVGNGCYPANKYRKHH